MSTNVNVGIFPKLHVKNGSSIADGGHLLHRVKIEHHDVCKTLQIRWKSSCVETLQIGFHKYMMNNLKD